MYVYPNIFSTKSHLLLLQRFQRTDFLPYFPKKAVFSVFDRIVWTFFVLNLFILHLICRAHLLLVVLQTKSNDPK